MKFIPLQTFTSVERRKHYHDNYGAADKKWIYSRLKFPKMKLIPLQTFTSVERRKHYHDNYGAADNVQELTESVHQVHNKGMCKMCWTQLSDVQRRLRNNHAIESVGISPVSNIMLN